MGNGGERRVVISQGDIFWVNRGIPFKSEPGYRRPFVVVQNNLLNISRFNTVVICGITTNLNRAENFGNVLLEKGEGNLPKASVVNITQILTVDKSRLTQKIGSLSFYRILEINRGLRFLFTPQEVGDSVAELRARYGSQIGTMRRKPSQRKKKKS